MIMTFDENNSKDIDQELYFELLQRSEYHNLSGSDVEILLWMRSFGLYKRITWTSELKLKSFNHDTTLNKKLIKLDEKGEAAPIIQESAPFLEHKVDPLSKSTDEALHNSGIKLRRVMLEAKLKFYENLLSCTQNKSGLFFYSKPIDTRSPSVTFKDENLEISDQERESNTLINKEITDIVMRTTELTLEDHIVFASCSKLVMPFLSTVKCQYIKDVVWNHLKSRHRYIKLQIKLIMINLKKMKKSELTPEDLKYYNEIVYHDTISNPKIHISVTELAKQRVKEFKELAADKWDLNLQCTLDTMIDRVKLMLPKYTYLSRRIKQLNIGTSSDKDVVKDAHSKLYKNNRGWLTVENVDGSKSKQTNFYLY